MPSSLCCQCDGILQIQLILTPRLHLGPNGSGKRKGQRKYVAKALTGRQMLILKAAKQVLTSSNPVFCLLCLSLRLPGRCQRFLGPSLQHISFIKFCIFRKHCYLDQIKNLIEQQQKSWARLMRHCVVTLSMEIYTLKAIYAPLWYLVIYMYIFNTGEIACYTGTEACWAK